MRLCYIFFFFFKQKTAYEIMPSLVGSEMCIRDRQSANRRSDVQSLPAPMMHDECQPRGCLLYTSDAADDLHCVDLGGRRIIKKKQNEDEQAELPLDNGLRYERQRVHQQDAQKYSSEAQQAGLEDEQENDLSWSGAQRSQDGHLTASLTER